MPSGILCAEIRSTCSLGLGDYEWERIFLGEVHQTTGVLEQSFREMERSNGKIYHFIYNNCQIWVGNFLGLISQDLRMKLPNDLSFNCLFFVSAVLSFRWDKFWNTLDITDNPASFYPTTFAFVFSLNLVISQNSTGKIASDGKHHSRRQPISGRGGAQEIRSYQWFWGTWNLWLSYAKPLVKLSWNG